MRHIADYPAGYGCAYTIIQCAIKSLERICNGAIKRGEYTTAMQLRAVIDQARRGGEAAEEYLRGGDPYAYK